jgi:hypothetical protein
MRLSNNSSLKQDQKILQTFKINLLSTFFMSVLYTPFCYTNKITQSIENCESDIIQNVITQLQKIKEGS